MKTRMGLLWAGLIVGLLLSGHLIVRWGGRLHEITPWVGRGITGICLAGLVMTDWRRQTRRPGLPVNL
jgi:hypothetical protein